MSTHNIGFYEEISKIITQLSSNIIKYPPYFFCWLDVDWDIKPLAKNHGCNTTGLTCAVDQVSRIPYMQKSAVHRQ